jgi:cytidylate kinase
MRLGWKLLDKDIIDAIAYAAHVDLSVVRHYDEHVDSWLRRINQQAMRSAALAAGLELGDNAVFDAQEMVKISQKIIEKAHADGNCVIVGRGSQCVLQHQPDVFHVFVYAPCLERIARLRDRLEPGANIEQRIRTVDGERAKYLQQFFGKCWTNPHLYDLMISSRLDEEFTARAILYAMTGQTQDG